MRLMGDRELAHDVLKGFCQDAPDQLKKLRARIDESDSAGLLLQTHTLKGSAATVGAEALRAVAQAMDAAAAAGKSAICRDLLPSAIEQLERFCTRLVDSGWMSRNELKNGNSGEMCVFGKAAKYVIARAKLLPRGDYVGT